MDCEGCVSTKVWLLNFFPQVTVNETGGRFLAEDWLDKDFIIEKSLLVVMWTMMDCMGLRKEAGRSVSTPPRKPMWSKTRQQLGGLFSFLAAKTDTIQWNSFTTGIYWLTV